METCVNTLGAHRLIKQNNTKKEKYVWTALIVLADHVT